MNENTNPNLNATRNSTRSSKAILIIDMPESCGTCPLRSYSNLALQCTPLRKTKETDDVCPLKPMPKKFEAPEIYELWNTDSEYFNGWNACVDELDDDELDFSGFGGDWG